MAGHIKAIPTLIEPGVRFFEGALPRRVRSFREFAEEEFVLPAGPRKGSRYICDFMPFSREILDEFSRGRFQEYWGSGPAQASKTLHFYVIPSLYHLFELDEDVIMGAPVSQMAKAAYLQRLLPAIQRTRYAKLLPDKGGGSRGGVSDLIQFGNGASIRFLGAGGGDQQIASYTARVVVATEIDKMDTPGKVSREADPVTKLKARTKAFGAAARFYGECTMSTKEGRIWREVVELGTDSRVLLPCIHCGDWIWPERSGLVGWQEAPDEMEARRGARFQCPTCGKLWTERDRLGSLKNPRVVARGQMVTREGAVEGPLPPTTAWGFRWNAMASPLTSIEAIAAEEWRAEQSGTDEDQKGVVQFVWAEAWEKKLEDLVRPDAATILRKIVRLERGVIPDGTLKMTLGIDVGSYVIWWSLVAWRAEARGHVVDFGAIDVPATRGQKDPVAVLNALRTFRDTTVKPGWGGRQPDMTLIDAGYEQEVVYTFVKESGEPRWLACRGFGTNSRNGIWKAGAAVKPTEVRESGNEWRVILQPAGVRLVAVHADHFKALVHDGFGAPEGAPGSLTLFHGDPRTDAHLRQFARQIVAEEREYIETAGKERKLVWVVKSKQNHWLDCQTYARCAAEILGIRLAAVPTRPRPVRVIRYDETVRRIRTKY